jgi:uncharacterized tellurite resistance protein B-like protein
MNLNDFSEPQRQALLDLALLAMYADGHLASVEDERVQTLLIAMGFATDYDRGRHHDASVTRVSRHTGTAEAARAHATALAQSFTTREQRQKVQDILEDLVKSDNTVAPQETSFLALLREILQR